MAIAKHEPLPAHRRRWRPRLALAAGLAVLLLLAWFWQPLRAYAQLGASYGAHIGCSCRFVSGRDLGECRQDFETGMGLVMLSEDRQDRSVTARFPLLSSQTATFREGEGCVLEKWPD
jgi:hypothetical protein